MKNTSICFSLLICSFIVDAQNALWPVRSDYTNPETEQIEVFHQFNQAISSYTVSGFAIPYLHSGIDLQGVGETLGGEYVLAPLDGIITKIIDSTPVNIIVYIEVTIIDNEDNPIDMIIGISHLSNLAENVTIGTAIEAGELIGQISATHFLNAFGEGTDSRVNHTHLGYFKKEELADLDPTEEGEDLIPTDQAIYNPCEIWTESKYKDPKQNRPEVLNTNSGNPTDDYSDEHAIRFYKTKSNYDEVYLEDNGILYGSVDIVVEAIDRQSTEAPYQIPTKVGYYIQYKPKKNADEWVNAVKTPELPYLLLDTQNWYGVYNTDANSGSALLASRVITLLHTHTRPDYPGGSAESPIDYEGDGFYAAGEIGPEWNVWNQYFTWNVTNTTTTDAAVDAVTNTAYKQVWATDAPDDSPAEPLSNGYSTDYEPAKKNKYRRFKDGTYRIGIRLEDCVHQAVNYEEDDHFQIL